MNEKYSDKMKNQIYHSSISLFIMASDESLANSIPLLRESLRDVAAFLQECSIKPMTLTPPSQQKVIAAIAAFGIFSVKYKECTIMNNEFSVTPDFYEGWKEQTLQILAQLLEKTSSSDNANPINFISHLAEICKKQE